MSSSIFNYLKSIPKTDNFRFYVYAYLRSKDSPTGKKGTPYYIGKGCCDRALGFHHKIPVPKDEYNIIIIAHNLSEIGAFALERFYIKWYGRKDICTGILINLTDGGEGTSGYKWTEEQRNSRSGENNHNYGKKHSMNIREKRGLANTGNKRTEEQKRNISNSKRKKIPIKCIETGVIFDGPSYAVDWLKHNGFLKVNSGNITNCCKGTLKTTYGYTWEYIL